MTTLYLVKYDLQYSPTGDTVTKLFSFKWDAVEYVMGLKDFARNAVITELNMDKINSKDGLDLENFRDGKIIKL